jgi:hypothetical protein
MAPRRRASSNRRNGLFTVQKIEVDSADGKTSFADDWLAGA